MAGTGGKRPGAGRKSNAKRLLEAGFVCRAFGPDLQERVWKSMLQSSDERIVLEAAKYLTDRVYGKAPQAVEAQAPPRDESLRIYKAKWMREVDAGSGCPARGGSLTRGEGITGCGRSRVGADRFRARSGTVENRRKTSPCARIANCVPGSRAPGPASTARRCASCAGRTLALKNAVFPERL